MDALFQINITVLSCQQMFTVSPNPASTEITVKTDTSSILKIDIMDKMSNIKKSFNYGTMRNNAVISISDLPAVSLPYGYLTAGNGALNFFLNSKFLQK